MIHKHLVVIYGPTGVGKTDFADHLANIVHGEIINADIGQFYTPLSIGTAKPLWQKSPIAHHLFDILDEPRDLTVTQYRELVIALLEDIWQRGNVPIIVGGSGFYIASLFFPPQLPSSKKSMMVNFEGDDTKSLWDMLNKIDPERAKDIHIHDRYRIVRALEIWHNTGIKPSNYVPIYDPPSPYFMLCLTRDRKQLYERINQRVHEMIEQGWIQEVKLLLGTLWENFLKEKKIIGYDDIIRYLHGPQTNKDYEYLIETIAQKTRNYAKRQLTFWRMMQKKLAPYVAISSSSLYEVNLTIIDSQVYIKQLIAKDFFNNKK